MATGMARTLASHAGTVKGRAPPGAGPGREIEAPVPGGCYHVIEERMSPVMRDVSDRRIVRAWLRCGLAALAVAAGGCGMGTDPSGALAGSVLSGLPRCDASLLHPRIAVGGTSALPGKSIVYVDGVMA